MKKISHTHHRFLNNCDPVYTDRRFRACYVKDIIGFIKNWAIGTFLGNTIVKIEEFIGNRNKLFKMGESAFTSDFNLHKTIRHGFIFYIVVALLAVPAGICSTQHHTLHYVPPLVVRPPVAVELFEELETPVFHMTAETITREIERMEYEAALAAAPPFYLPIVRAARTYGVEVALIRAIIMAESGNDPMAVSHRGAQGLMQLMPTTARWLGLENAFDPERNIDAGVRYFKRLLDRFDGDVRLALAAYNAGSRYVYKYNGIPPFRATLDYIDKVLNYRQLYHGEMAVADYGLITG